MNKHISGHLCNMVVKELKRDNKQPSGSLQSFRFKIISELRFAEQSKLCVTHPSCRRAEVKDSSAEEFDHHSDRRIRWQSGLARPRPFGGGAVSSFERLERA